MAVIMLRRFPKEFEPMKMAIENYKLKFMTELVKGQLLQEGIKRLFGRTDAALHVRARNSSRHSGYKMELSFKCLNCSKPRHKALKCQVRGKLTLPV